MPARNIVTSLIMSQVVMTRYAHASNKLLGIQIDAAINPGESAPLHLAHDLQSYNVVTLCTM